MQFNCDFHRFKPFQDFIAFNSLHKLASNEPAINAYFESMTLFSMIEKPIDTSLEEQVAKRLSDSMKEDIKDSINHFGGLTIIGFCTCFEVAAKDFFRSLFFTNPKSMHDYLEHRTIQGSVAFEDITNANSLDNLFNVLSERAAIKATKGNYSEVMRRVSKISKSPLDKDVSKNLDKIQKLRNKIAHEKHNQNWNVTEIEEFENIVGKGIEELCKAANSNGVPGNYSCIAPTALNLGDKEISVLYGIET